jgi:hypothetical protein
MADASNSGARGPGQAEQSSDRKDDRVPRSNGGEGSRWLAYTIIRRQRGRDQRGFGKGRREMGEHEDGQSFADEPCDGSDEACGMADDTGDRLEATGDTGGEAGQGSACGTQSGGGRILVAPSWNGPCVWHLCLDGKYRRIPAQSVLQFIFDGIPAGVGPSMPESGYPLAEKVEGRVAMLRGAGNAIVPQCGAEFVKAFLEAEAQLGGEPVLEEEEALF